MDLTPYVTTVEESLAAAAAAGDEQTRRAAAALTAALEPALRLGIMDALSELAFEVTDSLGDRVVELRLQSGQVRVVVTAAPAPPIPIIWLGEGMTLPSSSRSAQNWASVANGSTTG